MNDLVINPCVCNGAMGKSWDNELRDSESKDLEYVAYEKAYVDQEMINYANFAKDDKKRTASLEHMWNNESESSTYLKKAYEVYENYIFNIAYMERELPVDHFKQKIISQVNSNQIVILQGPTGCGKTTRVPQYVLDDSWQRKQYCNIVVAQPRKLAAINIARRVCEERDWPLGSVCGYQVRLEKRLSSNTLLTYMTTGVLLQQIISTKGLDQFTHIIIDDVHEQSQELDFLLIVVRRFIFTNSPKTKVILMSAAIEAEELARYFRCQNLLAPFAVPIIYIDKENRYIKSVFYIEEFSSVTADKTEAEIPKFNVAKPSISERVWNIFVFLVSALDKIDNKNPATNETIIGSVVVFLPGINEIEMAKNRLLNHVKNWRKKSRRADGKQKKSSPIHWEIMSLHSSMPTDSYAQVFKPPRSGYRKVILSTNISESSVTFPDIYYVIDFCLTKIETVNPVSKNLSIKLEWASHVSCEQRAGRVGRTGNGRVYRLVSRSFYDENMPIRGEPEMTRAPLDRVVLQAKMLDINECPQQILALALNPPNLNNIKDTILSLKEIGALRKTCEGVESSSDGDLTFLGTVMGTLPIDARLSKLIVLGHLFGCLDEAIIIAAGCSIQNIFSRAFRQNFITYKTLLLWADDSSSDFVALLNLFKSWQSCRKENLFEDWSAEHHESINSLVRLTELREWDLLVTDISLRLKDMNIKCTSLPDGVLLSGDEKLLILNVIIAGAFYPNFFLKVPGDVDLEERDAAKILGGRDPTRTVYFTGMDPHQPAALYVRPIQDMFRNEGNSESDVVVGFDRGSSKVYVEFKPITRKLEQVGGFQRITTVTAGKVPSGVYEAIRKRQLNYTFSLKLLPEQDAWEWAEKHGVRRVSALSSLAASNEEANSDLVSLEQEWIDLEITEHISVGHFWAVTDDCERLLLKMLIKMNKQCLQSVIIAGGTLEMGKLYAAKHVSNELYYRCKILSFDCESILVLFIDQGNIQSVKPEDICYLPDSCEYYRKPLRIECILHGIQPSLNQNPKGVWAEKVNDIWMRETAQALLCARVHSVVDDVVYVELFKFDPMKWQLISINQEMLDQGYAELSGESYLSQVDHEKRQQIQIAKANNPNMEIVWSSFDKVVNYQEIEAPDIGANCQTIRLKGPHSPLEMRVYGCTASLANDVVHIDNSSVNKVLLNTDLRNVHTRLLVAGHVGQTRNGLILRQTSMLPSIPGLPMILALLFCPTMVAKLTEDKTRVASILFGLGYDNSTNKSLYPSHDLTINLDTELTLDDITRINQIRFYMNRGIKSMMYGSSLPYVHHKQMIKIQESQRYLCNEVKGLIFAPRNSSDRAYVKFANDWKKNNTDTVVLKPNLCGDTEDIWQMLSFVELSKKPNCSD